MCDIMATFGGGGGSGGVVFLAGRAADGLTWSGPGGWLDGPSQGCG